MVRSFLFEAGLLTRKISPYLIVILLAAWALLTIRVGAAWFGHQEANGAWISVAVRNYQTDTALSRSAAYSTLTPDSIGTVEPYTHHPPLAVWLPTCPILLVGYNEAIDALASWRAAR